jgi:Flp pilus assembly protein TadG
MMRRVLTRHTPGQSLVIVAIVLPTLLALILSAIEVSARLLERAEIEDALKQATRSAVQTFDYANFARANGGLRVVEGQASSARGCDNLNHTSARSVACTTFLTNLTSVSGLQETPAQVAAHVQWTFLATGGTCRFGGHSPDVSLSTPMVCATVMPRMTGLLGWGIWTPQIDASDTLDLQTR